MHIWVLVPSLTNLLEEGGGPDDLAVVVCGPIAADVRGFVSFEDFQAAFVEARTAKALPDIVVCDRDPLCSSAESRTLAECLSTSWPALQVFSVRHEDQRLGNLHLIQPSPGAEVLLDHLELATETLQ